MMLGKASCSLWEHESHNRGSKCERFLSLCFLFFVLYYVNVKYYGGLMGKNKFKELVKDYDSEYVLIGKAGLLMMHGILTTCLALPITVL